MLNNKSQIKRRARRFFTQRACISAVADCTSTISGASLFQSRVTTLPATLKTCSDLEDAAGMAKMTLKIGARMNNGLQKIIEKSVYCKVKIPNQNKTLTSALTYCLPCPENAPPREFWSLPRPKKISPTPPRPALKQKNTAPFIPGLSEENFSGPEIPECHDGIPGEQLHNRGPCALCSPSSYALPNTRIRALKILMIKSHVRALSND